MSLVLAFIGKNGSVVAGDKREIALRGDAPGSDRFEEELYNGTIVSDEALRRRAEDFGIEIAIRDTKEKVQEREGILIGEITDFEQGILRRRRLYVTTGRFALAEMEGRKFSLLQQGEASRFVVLGNEIAQRIAHACIRERWKGGGLADAVILMRNIMETVSRRTASVSKEYTLIQTNSRSNIDRLIEQDRVHP
jgi:hypothetical protein